MNCRPEFQHAALAVSKGLLKKIFLHFSQESVLVQFQMEFNGDACLLLRY